MGGRFTIPEGTIPPTTDTPTDEELLDHFRSGDAASATAIYDRYAERLRGVIRRRCSRALAACVEPDDLLQSAFGSFFRRVADRATDGTHPDRLWGLLLLISVHKIRDAADYHYAAKRDARRLAQTALDTGPLAAAAIDETVLSELSDLVTHLVAQLPAPDDQMVRLRVQGYEVAEISNRTGRSKRTVERVLQGFRKSLESLIREC